MLPWYVLFSSSVPCKFLLPYTSSYILVHLSCVEEFCLGLGMFVASFSSIYFFSQVSSGTVAMKYKIRVLNCFRFKRELNTRRTVSGISQMERMARWLTAAGVAMRRSVFYLKLISEMVECPSREFRMGRTRN